MAATREIRNTPTDKAAAAILREASRLDFNGDQTSNLEYAWKAVAHTMAKADDDVFDTFVQRVRTGIESASRPVARRTGALLNHLIQWRTGP